jgi:hypothetical protein
MPQLTREERSEWTTAASAFTLLGACDSSRQTGLHVSQPLYDADTMETYFDSRLDLIQRSLQKHSDRLKMRAEETLETFKIRDLSGDLLAENFDREVRGFKLKASIVSTCRFASG